MTDYEFIQIISDNNKSHSEHERAFSDFYQKNRRSFVVYIKRKKRKFDNETIYDWYQDSCVTLFDAIRNGRLSEADSDIQLIHYLWRIGHNKYVDQCRKEHYKEDYAKTQKDDRVAGTVNGRTATNDIALFDDWCEASERISIIYQAVRAMAEPCNTILTLFYWDEMSGKEIAGICGYANEDSVKTQKYKCMSKLKAYIKSILK